MGHLRVVLLVSLALLMLCMGASAQTYTQTASVSGVYSTPFRAFSIPFDQGLAISWLEVGANTACSGQTVPPIGFVFVTLNGTALPCAPLLSGTPTVGTFLLNGVAYQYTFTMTTQYRCSGGRGGGCHTVFTLTQGKLTPVVELVN